MGKQRFSGLESYLRSKQTNSNAQRSKGARQKRVRTKAYGLPQSDSKGAIQAGPLSPGYISWRIDVRRQLEWVTMLELCSVFGSNI